MNVSLVFPKMAYSHVTGEENSKTTHGQIKRRANYHSIDVSDIFSPWFEAQLRLLKTQLDRAIEDMHVKGPLRALHERNADATLPKHVDDNVDVILLSGGLGGCQYMMRGVEDFVRMSGRLQRSDDALHPNLTGTRVLVSEQPQFCVALGLLEILYEPRKARERRKWSAFGFLKK